MSKKLVLSTHTFLWNNNQEGLMYNDETGYCFHFSLSNPKIESLCKKILEPNNLYSSPIDKETDDVEFNYFLAKVCEQKFGKLMPLDKPFVSFPPTPYILKSIERIPKEGINQFELLDNLYSLNFYLGGENTDNSWYRQSLYPINHTSKLNVSVISDYLFQVHRNKRVIINFIISENNDPRIIELLGQNTDHHFNFIFNPQSLLGNGSALQTIRESGGSILLIMSPSDIMECTSSMIKGIKAICPESCTFLVDEDDCISQAEKLTHSLGVKKARFFPIWNNNILFFKQNVCLAKEDFLTAKINKRQIHIHQTLNINFWGELTIMPDGFIFSDVNVEALGRAPESLTAVIAKEIVSNKAWRRIRNSGKCKECLYKWLCPSPSKFEYLSGYSICK